VKANTKNKGFETASEQREKKKDAPSRQEAPREEKATVSDQTRLRLNSLSQCDPPISRGPSLARRWKMKSKGALLRTGKEKKDLQKGREGFARLLFNRKKNKP